MGVTEVKFTALAVLCTEAAAMGLLAVTCAGHCCRESDFMSWTEQWGEQCTELYRS